MTEQERFERFQANEIKMDYEELKLRLDQSEKITGHRYGKNGQFFREWLVWSTAAQQKESVDIDADQLSNFIRKIDGNNSMGAGALAEHIVGWLKTTGYSQQEEGYVLVPVEREKL